MNSQAKESMMGNGSLNATESRSASSSVSGFRIIIAFDLDNMYVACERLKDPSLVGKPVGVQQKGLLATSSYEARALGVDKLCSLREARIRCPSLIIVNGEDLTLYRYYSRRVFALVRSLVKPAPVEKLGLDELFCDVTDLVANHLREASECTQDPRGVWFTLGDTTEGANGSHDNRNGFWYRPEDGCPGHTIPDLSKDPCAAAVQPSILAASFLAQHIRHLITSQIGLSASAGVAPSKVVAKLVGNLHKPNMQTTLVVSPSTADEFERSIRELLDPMKAAKLMGFGFKVMQTLRDNLPPPSIDASAAQPTSSSSLPLTEEGGPELTVEFLRTHFTASQFSSLLGQSGPKLWRLLSGMDDEPVKASPEFPLTISVEDSFDERRGRLNWQGVLREIELLAASLLRRLEIELLETEASGNKDPTGHPTRPGSATPGKHWLRYPSQIKLTIRAGHSRTVAYNAHRESRSSPLPVPVFDLNVSLAERTRALMKQPLSGLARELLEKGNGKANGKDGVWDISIINVAVSNLQTTKPTQAIDGFFSSDPTADNAARSGYAAFSQRVQPPKPNGDHASVSTAAGKRSRADSARLPTDLDLATLAELPPDIRKEILQLYGVEDTLDEQPSKRFKSPPLDPPTIPKANGTHSSHLDVVVVARDVGAGNPIPCTPLEDSITSPLTSDAANGVEESTSYWSDAEEDGEDEGGDAQCEQCGATIFAWSLQAHQAFHAME